MMIVKKQIPLAGPRDRLCGNCCWGDSKLHVCCAKDMVLTDEDLAFYSCGSWEPKKVNAFTTTENVIGMTPVNPVEVPLQPDGSLKMQARENIGCHIVNGDSITWATLRTRHCGNCLHQDGDEMCPNPGEPSREGCKNWESKKEKLNVSTATETVNKDAAVWPRTLYNGAEPCKAKVTFQYKEKQPVFGGTSLKELEEKQKKQEEQLPPGACCFNCEHRDKMSLNCKLKISDAVLTFERSQHEYCGSWEREQDHGVTLRVVDPEEDKEKSSDWDHQLEAKALDRGAKQGMTLEALDTVFAIACQQVPSMEQRWMELKGQINVMFAQKWAAEDMPK